MTKVLIASFRLLAVARRPPGGKGPHSAGLANNMQNNGQPSGPSTSQSTTSRPKVQQPKPQALPTRNSPAAILVSPCQKGNPVLNNVKSIPWEYSDIPSDYVLGATTCALFLSLKYHRLHPEYIYGRIRKLAGKYDLRILLVIVDIDNHEEPLRELSKTSLINNITVVLAWTASEAGRYLELFKLYEHVSPTAIRGTQASATFGDRVVDFVTGPRSINKTDAVGLLSNFGSVRTAINARPEEIGLVAGWGEKKVERWCTAVKEPFRIKVAARRGIVRENTGDASRVEARAASRTPAVEPVRLDMTGATAVDNIESAGRTAGLKRSNERMNADAEAEEVEAAWSMSEAGRKRLNMSSDSSPSHARPTGTSGQKQSKSKQDELSGGVASALARLRDNG